MKTHIIILTIFLYCCCSQKQQTISSDLTVDVIGFYSGEVLGGFPATLQLHYGGMYSLESAYLDHPQHGKWIQNEDHIKLFTDGVHVLTLKPYNGELYVSEGNIFIDGGTTFYKD